jgi:hypothetical protein
MKAFVIAMIVCVSAAAQNVPAHATAPYEVTQTDITKLERLRSTDVLTFGVRLGDSEESAEKALLRAGVAGKLAGEGLTVWDSPRREIAVFGIEDGRVVMVAWFPGMAAHLAGEARLLLDESIVDKDSALRLRLIGREDSYSVEGGRWGARTFSYDREGIRIIGAATPVVHLVFPSRKRE